MAYRKIELIMRKKTVERSYRSICWIFGDQLNSDHSWFEIIDNSRLFVIAELEQEASYCKHHIQKVAAFFSSMENFAITLGESGHDVLHLTLDDTADFKDIHSLIEYTLKRFSATHLLYQRPDEYRLLRDMRSLAPKLNVAVKEFDTEHFLFPYDQITKEFDAKKAHRMESFYRKMRKRFGILMEGEKPAGGAWNYDKENREKLKKDDLDVIPAPKIFENDVSQILDRIREHKIPVIGEEMDSLIWPVSRDQALETLDFFLEYCLPLFGRFQDAMTCKTEHGWSLYHSRLSFALNVKMLAPLEVITKALKCFENRRSEISLSQIEGFVRQILGWREFIRAIYWRNMPSYSDKNYFSADTKLPDYFWTGDTKMRCMQNAIKHSLEYSYSHHIHRLMVTGNFCMLTGIDPDEVDDWYLGVYIDAIQWVELPNTRGMSQYADGGIVASKPYAASGNYISKMSDYCFSCHYKVKEVTSDRACPFNSLYWHFMHKHADALRQNPRTNLVFKGWDRKTESERDLVLQKAKGVIDALELL